MSDYKKNLNQAGWVLVIFGLLDILVMIYCIIKKNEYFSSFNIFAVIAGIFLIRHNLKAANIVTKFSVFYLGGFLGAIVLSPWLMFKHLISISLDFRVFPDNLFNLLYIIFGFLLIWIYRLLTDQPVIEAINKANIKLGFWGKPSHVFFGLGLIISIVAVLIEILPAK